GITNISGTLSTIFLPRGSYTLRLTTRDRANNVAADSISFIITTPIPTPAEILQKVAENFGKIEDMKAKMIDFGTITIVGTNTIVNTFGPTERIFMQKKPDKVKITSVTGTPTTFILNGEMVYLSSEEIGIHQGNIDDMFEADISPFRSLEEIVTNGTTTLIAKEGNTYILEFEPEIEEISKVVIYVDGNNWMIMKAEVYDLDKTLRVITAIKEVSCINNIWIPSKYVEMKLLDEVTVAREVVLSNIELNTEILDSEFEP
ncbi:MAG: hypothetical protein AB1414_18840, partial [bacterium]